MVNLSVIAESNLCMRYLADIETVAHGSEGVQADCPLQGGLAEPFLWYHL